MTDPNVLRRLDEIERLLERLRKVDVVTSGAVTDGDYGDVEVSSSGAVWTVEGLQGTAITAGSPFLADVLTFNGTDWEPGPGRTYSGARVTRSAVQSINDTTDTAINFNAGGYDDAWSGSIHSTVTNNERLTVPADEDGIWQCYADISFASNATGYRRVDILWKDGSNTEIIARVQVAAINGAATQLAVSTEYNFAAGEWMEVHVYQNSGGALNVEQADRYTPIAIFRRIR